MTRAFYVIIGIVTLLASSCTQRTVCPAYQSAFIYDRNELRKKFSYFQEDSTPKVLVASKTKYLVAEPTPYRKKLRSIQTVEAKRIFVAVPDSISGVGKDSVAAEDLDRAARSVIDTIMVVDVPAKEAIEKKAEDSVYVISKDREVRLLKYNMPDSLKYDDILKKYVAEKPKYYVEEVGFNTEQDNYMWYLRHSLVLPDVRLAKLQAANAKAGEGKKAQSEKKGFFGFFKNLFKKKDKADIDSAELDIPGDDEFDYIDTTETVVPVKPVQRKQKRNELKADEQDENVEPTTEAINPAKPDKKKKKSKKDKTEKTTTPQQPQQEKKKEEDDDDGF
ncbi:hypothetical protein [Chryseosolibacter indicus]|uniref:DUF4837 family protein n=1 Tax=Chryseosolibacter indicus TaxID=2782351 RepID=A0ABS5VUY7_9BACT|nr:hypothetical protein [Chryseosolibacter indicus]MBT1705255.1 hypothetical protein [Chryseosolibacter indicus]